MHPHQTAAGLAQQAPQAVLVEALAQLRPALLDEDARIDVAVALERHIAMLQAHLAETLAAIEADSTQDGFTSDSVAAALRVPPASMRTRLHLARNLTERLPRALAMMRAGKISQRHAFDLAEATGSLSPQAVAMVQERVLSRAPEQTAAQFRACIKRAVLCVSNPADEQAAHQSALTQRRVIVTPVENGMAELWALLPADGAAAVKTALDARAHETVHGRGGDERTADQRRADALVDLASAALADPALVRGQGQRPAVQVTLAASTLMGLDNQPASWTGTARSPPRWPGTSPPTRPRRGADCSPTTAATSGPSHARAIGPPPT